jgi:hypothetical protein
MAMTGCSDRQEVLDVLYSYCYAIDYGDIPAWLECFTLDAVYDVRVGEHVGAPQRSVICTGHEQLRAFAVAHTHAPEHWHKHLTLQPIVTVAGDRASSVSTFIRVDVSGRDPYVRAFGRYRDDLARGLDGRWRIASRIAEVDAISSLPRPRRD